LREDHQARAGECKGGEPKGANSGDGTKRRERRVTLKNMQTQEIWEGFGAWWEGGHARHFPRRNRGGGRTPRQDHGRGKLIFPLGKRRTALNE